MQTEAKTGGAWDWDWHVYLCLCLNVQNFDDFN